MKRAIFSITICLFLFLSQFVSANQTPAKPVLKTPSPTIEKTITAGNVRLSKTYGKLPLAFEANEGQTDGQVKFLSRGRGYSLFLTPTETVLVLSKQAEILNPSLRGASVTKQSRDSGSPRRYAAHDDASEEKITTTAIRMGLVGANLKPKMAGEDKLPGKTNYLIGNDPKKWRTNVSNYKKVRYEEVYPGIDLVYYGNQRKLEYDFVVKPGANPKAIQLSFDGVESYSIENGGDLVLHTASRDVIQQKPVIYQEIKGQRVKVAGNYIFLDDEKVAFHLGDYDRTQALVIDPVLVYSTFLGGNGSDVGIGITVDSNGNAYVIGTTNSVNFPTTNGAFDEIHNVGRDAFVTKLNAAGDDLVYSTFLGGSGDDRGQSIVVDADGNAYVMGNTQSSNFPTTIGAYDETHNGGFDAFVGKLNGAGDDLVYSTFLGGSGTDLAVRLAVDLSGNAYVTGVTADATTDFPVTAGAFDEIHNGDFDAFVTKLNAAGDDLVYSTFLGGSGNENGEGIALDADGNAYVTGHTRKATIDFPVTAGAFDEIHNGDRDVYVSKLNAAGDDLVYSTFLGGNNTDLPLVITLDASRNAYVTGFTTSANFPTTLGAFDETHNGDRDVFVTKLNATGDDLVYSTFLGGNGKDTGEGIALDSDDNAYVTGWTPDSTINFPVTPGAVDETHNGDFDVFVTKLNAAGDDLVYSTFLGGNGKDIGNSIAVDADGNAYVTGSAGTGFPTTTGAFDETHNGSDDAFVSKIGPDNQPPTADAGNDQEVDAQSPAGANVTLNGSGSSDPDVGDTLTFAWTGPFGTTTGEFPNVLIPAGAHIISLVVNDGTVDSASDTVNITVQDTTPPAISASLIPVGEGDDDDDSDEGRFIISFSATDLVDPAPVVTAVLLVPGAGPITVTNGQLLEFEFDVEGATVEFETDDGVSVLEIEAPDLTLRVTATDASGNSSTLDVQPMGLTGDNDDDNDPLADYDD